MICHLSKEDEFGESMNGWLNIDDFLTKYYLANMTSYALSQCLVLTCFLAVQLVHAHPKTDMSHPDLP